MINEVNRPFIVGEKGAEICLYDDGYSEITFLPDNENWQVFAIYDNHGKIIEWYFDITRKNTVDERGNPYCDDLFLDIVLMPNGKIKILDEDELLNALNNGIITQNEFDMAYITKEELIVGNIVSVSYMKNICEKLLSLFNFVNK